MTAENPFHAARLVAMREEILRDGLLADKFLGSDPDVPTFGLNLACAWPFPKTWLEEYERMADKLSAFGPSVYVYPFVDTHVTLVTLASFARHVRPSAELIASLATRIPEILAALAPLFSEDSPERVKLFTLDPQPPVLTRGAGILPFLNPDGEVQRLRQRTLELLQGTPALNEELKKHGLNIPDIIHSTILRFNQPLPDPAEFLTAFDELAAETEFSLLDVREILLTSETKPYMRSGKVLRRLGLRTDTF